MTRFDQLIIGTKAELSHLITEIDIANFVSLTGDDNKLHVDKEYAQNTSFKRPVVHGMLSASFISTIIGTQIPGDGALWYSQSLEFLLPVRVGDKITVKAEIIGKIERLNAIELQTDVYNQEKQKVISGKAKVKIIEQEESDVLLELPKSVVGKVALVIGSTGGIGNETCFKLADLGYDIAIHYNSNEGKAKLIGEKLMQQGRKICIVKGDISVPSDVDEIVNRVNRQLGNISLLVNCAAIKIPSIKFENLDWDDVLRQININIKGNFNLAKFILPEMKKRKSGKIILLTTQATDNVPPPDWLPYVTAKHALNGFTRCLAIEVAAFNIQVNLVSPGMTDTELISDVSEKSRMLVAAKTPLKRLASSLDIAGAICFLASADSNYITGETIRVNGGQTML